MEPERWEPITIRVFFGVLQSSGGEQCFVLLTFSRAGMMGRYYRSDLLIPARFAHENQYCGVARSVARGGGGKTIFEDDKDAKQAIPVASLKELRRGVSGGENRRREDPVGTGLLTPF